MEQFIGLPGLTPIQAPVPFAPFLFRERENQD